MFGMSDKPHKWMSPERAIICACGLILCALWGYPNAPTIQRLGVLKRDWFSPGVLLGWVVIWAACAVALRPTRKR